MKDWFDSIFNVIQECSEYIDEAVKKKVIRKGKLVRKTWWIKEKHQKNKKIYRKNTKYSKES